MEFSVVAASGAGFVAGFVTGAASVFLKERWQLDVSSGLGDFFFLRVTSVQPSSVLEWSSVLGWT